MTAQEKLKQRAEAIEAVDPPRLDFPVKLEVESKYLNEMFKKVQKLSGKEIRVTIETDQDYLKIKGVNDFIKNDFKYLHGEKVDSNVKTSLTIEKIINIMKASSLTHTTELKLGEAMPISIKFVGISEDFSLEFLLAPRVENEN